MANILNREKQVRIISALAEDFSIRAIERMTGVHRDTIHVDSPVSAVRASIASGFRD